MPKVVDHEERRREIARATWRVIVEQGIQAVTVRSVAAAGGWSSGSLRHYFPTQVELLEFAADEVLREFQRIMAATVETAWPLRDFREALVATLPLDDERRTMLTVWLALVGARAASTQAADHGLLYAELHEFVVECLNAFAAEGWTREGDGAAAELHALLDGLTLHLLVRQITPDAATRQVTTWLQRHFVAPVLAQIGH